MKIDKGMHIEFIDMHSIRSQFILSHKKSEINEKNKSIRSNTIKNNNMI